MDCRCTAARRACFGLFVEFLHQLDDNPHPKHDNNGTCVGIRANHGRPRHDLAPVRCAVNGHNEYAGYIGHAADGRLCHDRSVGVGRAVDDHRSWLVGRTDDRRRSRGSIGDHDHWIGDRHAERNS